MSDMPAFCAALGSFHVKSSSTSFTTVLVTVCVLPFFLTVTFICFDTLMVSVFGVRWYTDQRYWSIQVSAPRHSSAAPKELPGSLEERCIDPGRFAEATSSKDGVSDRGIGRASNETTWTDTSVVKAASLPIGVACGASKRSGVARLRSVE